MTYREARMKAASLLRDAGVDNEVYDSGILLEFVCGIDMKKWLMCQMEEMPEDQETEYFEAVNKRASRIPLQHITGIAPFMGYEFKVDENVLTPRQDTEILVEEAAKIIRSEGSSSKVLDMCTGSGCIAISLQRFISEKSGQREGIFNTLEMTAADISEKALEIAKENSKLNETDVTFIHTNLFDSVDGRYDMIISNPPYIATSVIDELMPEVKDHEPIIALDGLEDGLHFYREIIKASTSRLNDGGWLLFEIGYDQGEPVSLLMKEARFTEVEVIKDLAGLDRVVKGRLNHV